MKPSVIAATASAVAHVPAPNAVPAPRTPRPKVSFMSPVALAPYKEQVWAIHADLVDWSRSEFEVAFQASALYAAFFVGPELVGLATVMEHEFVVDGRRIFTVGLGRALVLPAYRNQFLVQRALIYRWLRQFLRRPLQPIYIWGSCVSYKSYLAFANVLRVVYPVAHTPTPSKHEQVMNLIGTQWYGERFDPRTKTVRVPNFKVSDHQVIPTEADLQHPAIRFYCDAVPTAADATYGLLTISPCIRSNFLPMVGSWMRNKLRKALGLRRKTIASR